MHRRAEFMKNDGNSMKYAPNEAFLGHICSKMCQKWLFLLQFPRFLVMCRLLFLLEILENPWISHENELKMGKFKTFWPNISWFGAQNAVKSWKICRNPWFLEGYASLKMSENRGKSAVFGQYLLILGPFLLILGRISSKSGHLWQKWKPMHR